MVDHADRLTLAELVKSTSQDFAPFEVVGHGSITKINAVMLEQTMLSRHL